MKSTVSTQSLLDAHIHLWEYCLFSSLTNLAEVSSWEELVSVLEVNPIGDWRVGVRFNQESTREKSLPDRRFLDQAFGPTPVIIFRTCLHLAVANTSAMEKLGSWSRNGFFLEADVFTILNQLPDILRIQPEVIVRNGLAELEKLGIKKVIDMGMDFTKRHFFDNVPFYTTDIRLVGEALGFKLFLDGSLGARTAALTQEYSDDPGNYGSLNYSDDELLAVIEKVHKSGKPVACHAIGDRAVDQFLRVMTKTRHSQDRLEHAQYLRCDQIDALAEAGIAVCIQPIFSRELAWASARLGPERIKTAYAWGLLRDRGVRLLAGSDAPVDEVSPYAAAKTVDSLDHEHRLSYAEVIRLFAEANWEFYGWKPS